MAVAYNSQRLAVFTICSNNYVPMAKVLLASVRRQHKEVDLFLCLADRRLPDQDFYPEQTSVVTAEELCVTDFEEFSFRYDVMEFNTAVKPFMLRKLLSEGYDGVLYFDPDIVVFSRLDVIFDALAGGASFVLTPHLCEPAEGDAYPGDLGIMKAGIYNLGFLGVGAGTEAATVLRWWSRKLRYQCINDQPNGIFVDQRFMDLVPGFAGNARILRETSFNVAYWNLGQRMLEQRDGRWLVDGAPLGFFHFSGFSPRNLGQLSKHTTAFRGETMMPALRRLCQDYAEDLLGNGHGSISGSVYAYGRFASGTPIPELVRRMFRERHISWSGGNPFETYEEYLHLPATGDHCSSPPNHVTNLMRYLRDQNTSLQSAFNTATPAGVETYARWFIDNAGEWLGDERLAEPVAVRAGRTEGPRRPPASGSPEEPTVTVVGYLRAASGVGEAGRLTLRTLAYNGLTAEGLDVDLHATANIENSVDKLLVPRGRGRIQLFHVNADQFGIVLDHLGPALRSAAYRIIAPFWELAGFPDAWLPSLELADEVWAPTRFIQRAIVRKLPGKPVIHMPLALRSLPVEPVPRDRYDLPSDAFLFFFSFDYLSFVQRKNPLGAVEAFRQAFGSGRGRYGRVGLVIKTLNADKAPDAARAFREALDGAPDIHLIEATLSRDEVQGLMMSMDAVLSLHRSEGLGLLLAEAMALGKPVISTDYSASTELVTPASGYPVDFRLVPLAETDYPFAKGQVWAEPDRDHAAWQLRRVVADASERARKVHAARSLLERNHSFDTVGLRHLRRFGEIEGRPAWAL